VSEGQYHTCSHLFLFVRLGSGGQAESLTCEDKGYKESERSPDPVKGSSKTLFTVDPGFHPTVCISVNVLINFAITFTFVGHEVIANCGRAASLLYQDHRQQTSPVLDSSGKG